MTNFTGDGEPSKSFQQQFCLARVFSGIRFELICLIVLNISLSMTALLGNAIILVALRKESSLYPPSKLLFLCLATTDLCVGLISEPLVVINLMSAVKERWNVCYYSSCFGVSVFVHINCNKRGQTSRSFVRAEIQTCCNFEANVCSYNGFLGVPHCQHSTVLLE